MTGNWIALSDPDISTAELEAVADVLQSPNLSAGPAVEKFEAAFATYVGRKHAIAVSSSLMGALLVLKAHGVGAGDEVIASAYSWHEIAHAITLAGATPVFADIDYYAGTLVPTKVDAKVTDKTKAILAGNTNGHPALWDDLKAIAEGKNLILIEDSTEAIGSLYKGKPVGSFGDCAIFDFSAPSPLACGEGGMVVTDDDATAAKLRVLRGRKVRDRSSVVISAVIPLGAEMSDLTASLGLVQLMRIDDILARRKRAELWYYDYVRSFEGIKDPYVAPECDEVHWFLYLVHLGTRFTRSSRDAIIDDMMTEDIEAAPYAEPLHTQRAYVDMGFRRGQYLVTEKVADRVVALPFHGHLSEEEIKFIVGTMKDASINVGAGTAIYL